MLKLVRYALTLFAIFTLAGIGHIATAAQPSPEDMLSQLDGLQSAYSRKYVSSDHRLGFPTPVPANPSTPVTPDQFTPDIMLVTVLEFETADQVTQNFGSVMNGFTAKLILGESDIDLEETGINDLGDRAIVYTGETGTPEDPEQAMLLVVQDGNLGFLISAWGPDASMAVTLTQVAAFMVEAGPGSDPVTVDGMSAQGGTFDIMPDATDSEILHGLIPLYDYDLLLNGGTEPLEHLDHASPEATPFAS